VLRTVVDKSPDWPDRLREPWRELADASETASPFQTWEWHSTWWKHFRRSKRPYIVQVYEGEDLVGLMPLAQKLAPWRVLRTIGSGSSDYLHPLVRAGREREVAETLFEHLDGLKGIDLVDLHQVRETQPLAQLWRASQAAGELAPQTPIDQATCLVLDLPGSYDEFLAMLGKSLRYDVRRLDKNVFATGKARIVPAEQYGTQKALDRLFETHKKRWRRRGLPGAFLGERVQAFHREFAELLVQRGGLWLSVLEVEGQAMGAIYALRQGKTCYYYQAGFDPAAGSISPGTLLVAHTVRRAIDEGLAHFDFLRGDEPYKRRWKPQHELHNLRLLAPSRSMMGRLGQKWNRFGSDVERRVRARLEGKGLLR
jgi:CelD/BcsL family acetyltransferase involved in cellulose biosynthesis